MAAAGALAACQQNGGNENVAAPAENGSARDQAAPKEKPKSTILDTVSKSQDHSTLANALRSAGLTETMSGAGPYTVFAPTNAAFEKLPAGMLNGLLAPEGKGRLVALLTNHVVTGVVTAADLGRAIDRGKGKAQLATVGGTNLTFTRSGDAITVADAKGGQGRIAQADLLQSNGVIHSVDAVLMPQ
jgi:uncharacterized surface protein with fasciclin (FAS1) repeats